MMWPSNINVERVSQVQESQSWSLGAAEMLSLSKRLMPEEQQKVYITNLQIHET